MCVFVCVFVIHGHFSRHFHLVCVANHAAAASAPPPLLLLLPVPDRSEP